MQSQVTEPRDGTERDFKLDTPCKAKKKELLLTKLSCIVPTVIEEKLVFRGDVPRGAEVNFSIMRISYQVLLFPVPTAITTAKEKKPFKSNAFWGRGEGEGEVWKRKKEGKREKERFL